MIRSRHPHSTVPQARYPQPPLPHAPSQQLLPSMESTNQTPTTSQEIKRGVVHVYILTHPSYIYSIANSMIRECRSTLVRRCIAVASPCGSVWFARFGVCVGRHSCFGKESSSSGAEAKEERLPRQKNSVLHEGRKEKETHTTHTCLPSTVFVFAFKPLFLASTPTRSQHPTSHFPLPGCIWCEDDSATTSALPRRSRHRHHGNHQNRHGYENKRRGGQEGHKGGKKGTHTYLNS